jgi:glycosyltransferase involved in cell wall biosynthesis
MLKRTAPPRPIRRVAFVGGSARNLVMMRAPLMRALMARGIPVMAVAPHFSADEEAKLEAMHVERATFALTPRGPRLLADFQIVRELKDKLAAWQADAVLASGGRVMSLALIAAARARVARRIALVNGLPSVSALAADKGAPDLSAASPRLLARGLAAATAAVLHNRDDQRRLLRTGALAASLPTLIVPGAGVDLAAFAVQPLPSAANGIVFLMLATLDRARGVLDYCAAARDLKARAPQARFLLAGPAGDGPTGLKPEALRPYADAVTFLGPLVDVRPALAECHVVVYPSHAEGMPRAILEALATGRPVVTTETPGCRDTVDDRVNGCLVPAGDAAALQLAMASFLKRPDLLPAMARASRLKAERHFDERAVIAQMLDVIGVAEAVSAAGLRQDVGSGSLQQQ